ncbi:MAG: hypothetical protein ACYTFG_07445 [Planctomycetota bacterium]|jgi:hypothetical protein
MTRTILQHLLVIAFFLSPLSPALAVDVPKDPQAALALGRAEKQKGLSALNKARRGGQEETKLAKKAMNHLEAAQELYSYYLDNNEHDEKAEEEMSDLQSLLYWCRKMTPLRDEPAESVPEPPAPDDEGKTAPPTPLPRSPLEGPPPGEPAPDYQPPKPRDPNEVAREWYEDAERFARQFPTLTLQIVAAYFRVADKFRDTEWGMKALEKAMGYAKGWKKDGSGSAPPPKAGVKPAPEDSHGPVVEDPTLLRIRLRHKDPQVRIDTIESLVHTIGAEAWSDLHELFLSEESTSVRKVVLRELIKLKDKRTKKSFKKLWNIRDKKIAEDFIRLVCAVGTYRDVKYAVYTTVVNVDRLRPPNAQNLIDRGGEPLDSFISSVRSAYSHGPRKVLLESCKKMGTKGPKGLTGLFKTRGLATREAILTLGALQDVKSGKYVVIYLAQYKAGAYRGEALASLKMMGDEIIPFLIQTLGKPKLKMWAAWLLRNITGQTYSGGNPGKWWAWWKANRRR